MSKRLDELDEYFDANWEQPDGYTSWHQAASDAYPGMAAVIRAVGVEVGKFAASQELEEAYLEFEEGKP